MQKITLKRVLLFSITLVASIMLLVGLAFPIVKLAVLNERDVPQTALNIINNELTKSGFDLLSFKFGDNFMMAVSYFMDTDFVNGFGYGFGALSVITLAVSIGAIITVIIGFFKISDKKLYKVLRTFVIVGVILATIYSVFAIVFSSIMQNNFEEFMFNDFGITAEELRAEMKIKSTFFVSMILQIVFLAGHISCSLAITDKKTENASSEKYEKIQSDKANSVDGTKDSVEAFSELIKKYKELSEQGVINVTEYIEKNAKAVNFYADRCNIELSKLAKGANVKDVLTAETVALDVIKNAKELLDNNYITTENYLTIRAKLLNAVIK